jgi:serine protease AprX
LNTKRFLQFLIIASLFMAGVGSAPRPAFAGKAQPQLMLMAAEQPDALVRVIVQQSAGATGAQAQVAKLGGAVTQDLRIINAFAAEMTAQAALKLARNEAVRWVSLDAPVENAGKPRPPTTNATPNTYLDTLGVTQVWKMGLHGEEIGVAVIDSGITMDRDFSTEIGKPFTRVVRAVNFYSDSNTTADQYGHGTHVAGIIGGNGGSSPGAMYAGIAPKVNLISLKVNDDVTGMCYESDVVEAMQWVYDNKAAYNIRVVNMSLNSTVQSSYNNSPMDAAAEILWFNGVVVVASAGNYWSDNSFDPVKAAPANDPFIITVGATDEKLTTQRTDDIAADFSSFGNTLDGYFKPDIYAPGKDIRSVLSDGSNWKYQYPDRVELVGEYFRLSGTSMAAPMVTGAVALLLQDEPNLTPDQVKYRLTSTASWLGPTKYLDVYAAVTGTTTESANTGLVPSQLLATGPDAVNFASVGWNSVGWNSVGWNSVGWNSVGWNSVGWNSVGWNSTFWGP